MEIVNYEFVGNLNVYLMILFTRNLIMFSLLFQVRYLTLNARLDDFYISDWVSRYGKEVTHFISIIYHHHSDAKGGIWSLPQMFTTDSYSSPVLISSHPAPNWGTQFVVVFGFLLQSLFFPVFGTYRVLQ